MGRPLRVFKGVVVSAALLLLLTPGLASAAGQGTNITTSPISADLSGKPGQTISTTLQVENNASTPVPIDVQLETFQAYGTSGQAQILPFQAGDDAPTWVHFSKTSFVAAPGIWIPVQMTINLPRTASLGYYYAVLFKPQVKVNAAPHRNVIQSGNAILILVDATSGNAHPNLILNSFTADRHLYEYLPVNFSISVQNDGNIFLPPRGDIYISRTGNFAHPIDTIDFNSGLGNVLPNTSRVFTASWAKGFPAFTPKTIDGQRVTNRNGQLVYQLKWNFSQTNTFRFGRYYARLVLVYNNGFRDVPIMATLSFWVIPWKLLGLILVVLALTAVGLYVSGRKVADRTYRFTKRVRRR